MHMLIKVRSPTFELFASKRMRRIRTITVFVNSDVSYTLT